MQINTHSSEETKQVGKDLAQQLHGSDILLLSGDLGTGKTTFTKGLLSFFGIDEDDVASPTFTLVQEYTVSAEKIKKIVHIDTYRMEDAEELVDIGLQDYLDDDQIILIIEWPEKILPLIAERKKIEITLDHGKENERIIEIKKEAE